LKRILNNLQYALPIALTVVFVHINRRGIGDLDSWWHVQIGDQIRAGIPFDDLGKSWSLYSGNWRTSQWLSELLMSFGNQVFGWRGLLWWRLFFGLLLLLGFVISLARKNSPPSVIITSIISYFALASGIQERPALIGMIFIVVLGASCYQIWLTGYISKFWWLWLPATTLWANLHGSWILAPASFSLACALALTHLRSMKLFGKSVLLVSSVALAGCLTPIGWHGLLLPFKLQNTAGKFIVEWQRTNLKDPLAYGLLVLLAILILLWIRGRERPTIQEFIWVLVWTIFAFTAFRNVGPATLFIAPVVAHRLNEWFDRVDATPLSVSKKWLTRPFVISLAVAFVIVFISTLATNPLKGVKPRFIAQRLSLSQQDLRIINDYNVSGVLLALGGKNVHLAVDGRADRFDPKWLAEYLAMLSSPEPNQSLLNQLQPNAAVLRSNSPLIWHFIQSKHWRKVMTEGPFVLIADPSLKL